MKRAIAFKWASALESGRYKQGREQLKDGDTYCCLGVLCKISRKGKFADNEDFQSGEDCNAIRLNSTVRDYAGMISNDGALKSPIILSNGKVASNLMNVNDYLCLSFKDIAKIIRKHWKEL